MLKYKNKLLAVLLSMLLVSLAGCWSSTPSDLAPIINGRHDVDKIYYLSTDDKVAAIVITKGGDLYYYRANGFGTLRDEKLLFNINDAKAN